MVIGWLDYQLFFYGQQSSQLERPGLLTQCFSDHSHILDVKTSFSCLYGLEFYTTETSNIQGQFDIKKSAFYQVFIGSKSFLFCPLSLSSIQGIYDGVT